MGAHFQNQNNKRKKKTNGTRYRPSQKHASRAGGSLSGVAERLKGCSSACREKLTKLFSKLKRKQAAHPPSKIRKMPARAPAGKRYRSAGRPPAGQTPVVIPFEKKPEGEEKPSSVNLPTSQQLETELKRERGRKENSHLVRNLVFALLAVAAAAVLVATLFLPILQIYGTSMTPTLSEGDVVVALKGSRFERGDVVSFYYNNKILVKRVIAFEGEYVNIDDDGNVYINNRILEEPYLQEGMKSFGECNLELPYQVPSGRYFVLGDHRATSVDSRSSVMGCVSEEQIVGRIKFRVWPVNSISEIK